VIDPNLGLVPATIREFWDRFVKFVYSVQDFDTLKDVAVSTGAEGTLVRHGLKRTPKTMTYVLKGTSAVTAIVTYGGAVGHDLVRVYATANCTIDLTVWA
jgi:hypothetical protein